jgi:CheY-like chemotaxis protein
MKNLPLFYYPTTILWVDDNLDFVRTAENLINVPKVIMFNNADECLRFLDSHKNHYGDTSLLQSCTDNDYYDTVNHAPVDLNVSAITKISENFHKHKDISVLIVDYKMPGMSGIELCRKLKDLPIKKILLTGEANSADAIAAFNENIIDRYIQKSSKNLITEIEEYIYSLSHKYFIELTKGMVTHLEADRALPFTDEVFVEFFHQWRKEHSISEYYLMDKTGSILAISNKGEKYYFILHDDHSLESFVSTYQEESDTIISQIKNREKIPFFGIGKEAWQFQTMDWYKYLFTPNRIEGREKYFWCSIKVENECK